MLCRVQQERRMMETTPTLCALNAMEQYGDTAVGLEAVKQAYLPPMLGMSHQDKIVVCQPASRVG